MILGVEPRLTTIAQVLRRIWSARRRTLVQQQQGQQARFKDAASITSVCVERRRKSARYRRINFWSGGPRYGTRAARRGAAWPAYLRRGDEYMNPTV